VQFFEYSSSVSKEWDDFVLASKQGSLHQISVWKPFQETISGRGPVKGWGMRNKAGKIVATTFAVKMDTGFQGKKWWYSARGPVFNDEKQGHALIEYVEKELKKEGGLFWRFDPYISQSQVRTVLNFKQIQVRTSAQNYQPTDTLILDVTKTNDQLLSEMKRKGRYNINLAEKKGVQCIKIEGGKVTEKDLDDFWRLNNETTNRDSFSGHEKAYYRNFLTLLAPYADLFFAEAEDGIRIATAISTFAGDKAIYYFGASTSIPEYRNLMAPYLLQWTMIQEARERGCRTYDFLGIAPENEPKHAYAGISEFKWKFGGTRQTFAPGKEIVFDKKWYWLYRIAKKIR
jgi:lipid II:glycine glycyltransferase (peptidoglycan interpeptide bridge formation enzyme)